MESQQGSELTNEGKILQQLEALRATELRIGNWVNYNGYPNIVCSLESPQPLKDKRFSDKWVVEINPPDVFNVTLDELSAIPLTEEWLVRLGFEYIGLNKCFTKDVCWFVATENRGTNYVFGHVFQGAYARVMYVHQLQNLYFALTGEELELKKS